MIGIYERQYITNLTSIYHGGYRSLNERTGIITRRLPSTQFSIPLSREFPILQSKKVQWKTAVKEVLWMMQQQSNVTSELGSKIWDNWTGEDGTIGKTYGYQIAKPITMNGISYPDQVRYVLDTLANDKSDRRCVIDMWNVSELHEMNLVPCCYSSIWNIINGKLNCMIVQRSADYPVGVPFDTLQYAALTCMFARHLNVEPGLLTHVMADSHIYENQLSGVEKQMKQYDELVRSRIGVDEPRPKFVIAEGATDFFKMTMDDFEVINYNPMPAIKFEVAV